MNRSILSAALFLSLAAPAAFAQAAPTSAAAQQQHQAHNPHKSAMKMGRKLGLSQDQTAKLEPILAQRKEKMQALKADTALSPDQKKAQRKAIQEDTRAQMGGVLTPEQMTALKQMHRDHKRASTGTQS